MKAKLLQKEEVTELRKKGCSYKEIREKVKVSKSSLSLWLKGVYLTDAQKERLIKKRLNGARKGSLFRNRNKQIIRQEINNKARKEINSISKMEMYHLGAMLYWAEGAKEKEKGSLVIFSNSDPLMIKFVIRWLGVCFGIKKDDLIFQIYIHNNSMQRIADVVKYWMNVTETKQEVWKNIYYKKNKITNRKKINDQYFGLVRIVVKKSTNLNRKIEGLIQGICEKCRVV